MKQKITKSYLTIALLNILLLSILFFVGCSHGVVGSGNIIEEDRSISNFDSIDISTIGTLIITQDQKESLTITADDNIIPLIRSKVERGELKISSQDTLLTDNIVYKLSIKDISSLDISGSANVKSESIISDNLSIEISGSGEVSVEQLMVNSDFNVKIVGSGSVYFDNVSTTNIKSEITGSGEINVSGFTDSQTLEIAGSGNYNALDLKSNDAEIQIIGSGDAFIDVIEILDTEISGSGSIFYKGRPFLTSKITGSGEIKPYTE